MYISSEDKEMFVQRIFDSFDLHGLILVMAIVIGLIRIF